jgi:hypothetical protein
LHHDTVITDLGGSMHAAFVAAWLLCSALAQFIYLACSFYQAVLR